ncbi:MAG: metallophosphatase family protein, partial [Lentisphaerae bacterium]
MSVRDLLAGGRWQYRVYRQPSQDRWYSSLLDAAAEYLPVLEPLRLPWLWEIFLLPNQDPDLQEQVNRPEQWLRPILPLAPVPETFIHVTEVNADRRGKVDLVPILGRPPSGKGALARSQFFISEAGEYHLILSADWACQIWIDGRIVFDTLATGNGKSADCAGHHICLGLEAGNHDIIIFVVSGSGGWAFTVDLFQCRNPQAWTHPPCIVEARIQFSIDSPNPYQALEYHGKPGYDALINGEPILSPIAGLAPHSVPGIPASMLHAGVNRFILRKKRSDVIIENPPFDEITGLEFFLPHAKLYAIPSDQVKVTCISSRHLSSNRPQLSCLTTAPCELSLTVDGRWLQSPPAMIHTLKLPHPPRQSLRLQSPAQDIELPVVSRASSFIVISDPSPNPHILEQIANLVPQHRPDFIIFLGDLVTHGRHFECWQREFFRPCAHLLQNYPTFAIPGNHDEDSPLFYKLFGQPP